MKVLKLNALCGVKNQMYCANQYIYPEKTPNIQDDFVDINSLFWSRIFSPAHIKAILSLAKIRLKNTLSPKVQAVINEPELFFETYKDAINALEIPVTEQILFESLETLEIICYLHSKLYSDPFALTITDGYIHSTFSAQDLEKNCCLPYYNPYLPFIESEIIPLIINYKPDILLLTGKPNIASFAIAKIAREKLNKIFIIASEHESDYYSLRKIKSLLVSNTAFFSVYHCIILNDNTKTLEQIKEVLSGKTDNSLFSVPGIIFSTDNGNIISYTKDSFDQPLYDTLYSYDKKNVLNLKAFPQNHCYWNKCTFCGINSKYEGQENKAWDIDILIEEIKKIYTYGIKKIWLLDEAIPVSVLRSFAEKLISYDIHIKWHVRARIDPDFTDKSFINLLRKSGLRHILFGLESASKRILQLAKKNNNNFDYIEIAEKIVDNLTENKIAVHFSAILGFPTETKQEREETCNFLKYIFNTYKDFSYNVNTFYLDIGSTMYKRWEYFNISCLSYPCAPNFFMENHLDWNSFISSNKNNVIRQEQDDIMRFQYSWYPEGTLLHPSDFFSFWEYSRYCLSQPTTNTNHLATLLSMEQAIILSPMVSFCKSNADSWLLYHLKNHHYVIGGSVLKDLANASQKKLYFKDILKKYERNDQKQVESLIINLTRMDFFILEK